MAARRSLVSVFAFSALACCTFATAAHAQRSRRTSNPTLRGLIVRGDLSGQDSLAGRLREVGATSWLPGYEPGKGWDSNSSDAWCEGVAGVGVGEMLVYAANYARDGTPEPLVIWAGYGKSPALFGANGRPRGVRVWTLGIEAVETTCRDEEGFEVCDFRYQNPQVVGSMDVELRDVNDWQPLPYPQRRVTLPSPEDRRAPLPVILLGIEILSVYPGDRYTDTCISGIGGPAVRPVRP